MLSSKKCLFWSSAHFSLGFCFLLLSCVSCLYILKIKPLSVLSFYSLLALFIKGKLLFHLCLFDHWWGWPSFHRAIYLPFWFAIPCFLVSGCFFSLLAYRSPLWCELQIFPFSLSFFFDFTYGVFTMQNLFWGSCIYESVMTSGFWIIENTTPHQGNKS